jgi:hypothetical protein
MNVTRNIGIGGTQPASDGRFSLNALLSSSHLSRLLSRFYLLGERSFRFEGRDHLGYTSEHGIQTLMENVVTCAGAIGFLHSLEVTV